MNAHFRQRNFVSSATIPPLKTTSTCCLIVDNFQELNYPLPLSQIHPNAVFANRRHMHEKWNSPLTGHIE
jgi:hypothetical protein